MRAKKIRKSRIVYACVAAAYFAAVVWATVYAQTGYVEKLPAVTLLTVENGMVPRDVVQTNPQTGKLYLNVVLAEEGPWGERYVIRQTDLVNYREVGEDALHLFGATKIAGPIVETSTGELYDGLEVRLEDNRS